MYFWLVLNECVYNIKKSGMYGYSSYANSSYGSGNRSEQYRPPEKAQPLDTVSSILWDPYHSDPAFFSSSWDGHVRYYVIKATSSSVQIESGWEIFLQHPVLCCDISPDKVMFAGLATGDIAVIQMENSNVGRMGFHDAPICGLFWLQEKGCLMSLGFDDLIRFWTFNGNGKPDFEVKLPMKTHTCSLDWPYLLIGSSESTISIVNLKSLPNVSFPKHADDYMKSTVHRFSKFNCSRILGGDARRGIMGTVDGRFLTFSFRETIDKCTAVDIVVSKVQKKSDTRNPLYGQVNCVDLGYSAYQAFAYVGGTENLQSYNLVSKNKVDTVTTTTSSVGACNAIRISPKQDYVVYATGTDWTKGIHELENLKRPRIGLVKLSQGDVKRLTMRG